jgi:hypothetical protein
LRVLRTRDVCGCDVEARGFLGRWLLPYIKAP